MGKEKDTRAEYLNALRDVYKESASQFDKQVLYISSGSLGVSLAFIKDIVKLSEASHKWSLITAWTCLTSVVLLSVISHFISLRAINQKIADINDDSSKKAGRLNSFLKFINILTIILMSAGLTFLILFTSINV